MLNVMVIADCDFFTAMEAVASTAIEHPEWDMDRREKWDDWEAILNRQKGM